MANANDNFISTNITILLPNQPYNIWIRAYTANETYNQSALVQIETLPEPENITLINATSQSLIIDWRPYTKAIQYVIEYRPLEFQKYEAKQILNSVNFTNQDSAIQLIDLNPKTQYIFRILLYFPKRNEPYIWPQDDRFVFETYGDKPSAPGRPLIIHLRSDVYKVSWGAAMHNGAIIEEYSLEGLRYRVSNRGKRSTDSITDEIQKPLDSKSMITATPLTVEEYDAITDNWTVYYNGTDTYWIIKDLTPVNLYSFRVRARNSYGWGDYSDLSDPITEQYVLNEHREYLIIAITGPVVATFVVLSAFCILRGKYFQMLIFLFKNELKNIWYFVFSISTKKIG